MGRRDDRCGDRRGNRPHQRQGRPLRRRRSRQGRREERHDGDETKDAGDGDENGIFVKLLLFVLVATLDLDFIFTFLFCHRLEQAVTVSAILAGKGAAGKLLGGQRRAVVGP